MSKYKAHDFIRAIDDYSAAYGYPPSVRDLQKSMGVSSTSVVAYWLKSLRERGLIDYRDGADLYRSLSITREGQALIA